MSTPLVFDLFCGKFGWSKGFVAEGYRAIGFDLVHEPHHGPVPEGCDLVLQDILTLHGAQLKDATAIVASPPCQAYSYRAQPWKRAKAIVPSQLPEWWAKSQSQMTPEELREWISYRENNPAPPPSTELFDACFRIQREASEAAGHHIPMVVENVKGAQPWVGPAQAKFGSFYLWGSVESVGGRIVGCAPKFGESLRAAGRGEGQKGRSNFHFFEQTGLPSPSFHGADHEEAVRRHAAIKNNGGSWFNVANNTESGTGQNPDGRKVPGINWSGYGEPGYKAQAFNSTAEQRYRATQSSFDALSQERGLETGDGLKINGYSDPRRNGGKGAHLTSQSENDERGIKQGGSGPVWFDTGIAKHSSKSNSRQAASAAIAEIPLELARYIARILRP